MYLNPFYNRGKIYKLLKQAMILLQGMAEKGL